MSAAQVVGVIADVFTWTTLPLGLLCLLIAAVLNAWWRGDPERSEVGTLRLVGGLLVGVGLLSVVLSIGLTFAGG
ncbi:hypothetical protein EXU48_18215 [Occultella glacieicola]|uniref:Uncharacterized protein n=1 Tax=Occultella glacieicola TaxID=2518684 RepID=A0ABY2E0Z5_9MICO|nr:hypothetical protein [Occultella glacieicola]TDE90389.1 hypothetical protein EXU48_18215 [Occultella glacieicola]